MGCKSKRGKGQCGGRISKTEINWIWRQYRGKKQRRSKDDLKAISWSDSQVG